MDKPAKKTVIGILNQKGGAGKTTVATNLIRAIILDGLSALLVDQDPQGSASEWHHAGGGDNALVVGLGPTIEKDLEKLPPGFEWVIIDGAPFDMELASAGIASSDIVVIPVQPSPWDIWAVSDLVEMIKVRQRLNNGKPKAAFLISRAVVGTNLSREVEDALSPYEIPVMRARTHSRKVYAEAPAKGNSVLDDEPDGKAAEEVREIFMEIKQILGKIETTAEMNTEKGVALAPVSDQSHEAEKSLTKMKNEPLKRENNV
jgi:chromosome partitioning protein